MVFSCSPSRASGLYFGSHWSVMLIGSALMKSFVSSPVKSIALTSKLLYTVCVQPNESQYIGDGTTVHAHYATEVKPPWRSVDARSA